MSPFLSIVVFKAVRAIKDKPYNEGDVVLRAFDGRIGADGPSIKLRMTKKGNSAAFSSPLDD